jgi:hypothetical protein
MQNQSSNTKNIVMAVVLIVLLVIAYFMFFKGEEVPLGETIGVENLGPDGMPIANGGVGLGAGADLLPFLLQLNSLKLDDSIFSDPVFVSLEDYTIEIAPQPQGRSNPFAPLGGESRAQAGSSRIPAPRLPVNR